MPQPQLVNAAWRELRLAREHLAKGNKDLPAYLHRTARRKARSMRTGMLPAQAIERLSSKGADAVAARQAVAETIKTRFPAFAGSWQDYISNGGYIFDLWRLPEERRAELAARLKLDRLLKLIAEAAADPIMAISNFPLLQELSQLSSRANNREDPDNPARVVLIEKHGLAPELATAVMLYSRTVPWWAHLILIVMVLICLGMFILAIAEPNSEMFHTEDFNGANWVHYTVLPLFIIGMSWAEVYLLRNRKRWDKAWQDALTAWYGKIGNDSSHPLQ